MKDILNTLIVDDHPMIVEGFIKALEQISKKDNTLKFHIDTAENCQTANDKIERATQTQAIDLVFLDINLPPFEEQKILSCEDLGKKIKKLFPKAKVLILTAINNNLKISHILRNVNPDGFLIKNDINHRNLEEAIITTIKEPPFYSKSALRFLRKQSSHQFELEDIDTKLLYELSCGTKMKNLPDILLYSMTTIVKTKKTFKRTFWCR